MVAPQRAHERALRLSLRKRLIAPRAICGPALELGDRARLHVERRRSLSKNREHVFRIAGSRSRPPRLRVTSRDDRALCAIIEPMSVVALAAEHDAILHLRNTGPFVGRGPPEENERDIDDRAAAPVLDVDVESV